MAEVDFLRPTGAFDALMERLDIAPPGHVLAVAPVEAGIATVMARGERGREAIGQALGLDPPTGPFRAGDARMSLIGIGPGRWLAINEGAGPRWAGELARWLDGIASVSDQSSAYAMLRLTGSAAGDLLQRGAFVDLHPSIAGPGTAIVTDIAHMGVMICRIGEAGWDVAPFRSHAASFWHWLEMTAAAMGVVPMRAV